MKKLIFFAFLIILTACSKTDDSSTKLQKESTSIDKETVFSFNAENLTLGCESDSEMICAINTTIKCTINPDFEECGNAKQNMPDFVFMQDESLQRPTFQSYQVDKITPREDGQVEIRTKSSCNGNWFGLCNGNIIYVMKYIDSRWVVTDMYAVEF